MSSGTSIDQLRTGHNGSGPLEHRVQELEARLATYEGHSPAIRITRQPLTYDARLVRDTDPRSPRGLRAVSTREQRSYIQDFCLAQMNGDTEARERLQAHTQEMKAIGETRERLFHPDAEYRLEPEIEKRAVNWSAGTGGYFAPPLWLIEQFAIQPTPERVLSKLAPSFELPEGVQSVNIPALTTGIDVNIPQLGGANPTPTTVDQAPSSAVVTIAGNYDVPMQMLEQSAQGAHLDWLAFTTMEARYGYQLEQQLLTGTGAAVPQGSGNNQLLGIYNNTAIPAANIVSYTGTGEASPGTTGSVAAGATAMFGFLGFLIAKVGQNRLLPPEGWLMTTSRGAWLGSSEDSQNRPLMIADNPNDTGTWDLLGYPVYMNDAIPRTSGVGGNEERIIVFRQSDWVILESERRTSVGSLRSDTSSVRGRDNAALGDAAMGQVLSGTLMVRLQMRRYVAAVLRYPTSVAYLSGSGMATGGGW